MIKCRLCPSVGNDLLVMANARLLASCQWGLGKFVASEFADVAQGVGALESQRVRMSNGKWVS